MSRPSIARRNALYWRLRALPALVAAVLTLTACGPETLIVGFEPATLLKDDSPVQSVAFSPDGALLAAGSGDGTVRLWAVAEGRPVGWPLLHARRVSTGDSAAHQTYDVAFSPDSRTLAFGLPDGSVRLWRLSGDDGERAPLSNLRIASLHTLRQGRSVIASLDFSPDGRTLAAGTGRGSVHLWQVSDGTHLDALHGHTGVVVSVAFSPDGTTLASAALDGTTKLWNVSNATLIRELEGPSVTTGVAFSPDGSRLVTAGATDDGLWLWQVRDWSPVRELGPARGGMGNVAFSPDGTMVAAGNAWYEVRWWRVADGRLLQATRAHHDSVNSVAFSPNGKRLASGSLDGTVKVWGGIGGAAGP